MTFTVIYVVSWKLSTASEHAKSCEDREIEIIHELAQKVLEYEEILIQVSDVCGQLDW